MFRVEAVMRSGLILNGLDFNLNFIRINRISLSSLVVALHLLNRVCSLNVTTTFVRIQKVALSTSQTQ